MLNFQKGIQYNVTGWNNTIIHLIIGTSYIQVSLYYIFKYLEMNDENRMKENFKAKEEMVSGFQL